MAGSCSGLIEVQSRHLLLYPKETQKYLKIVDAWAEIR
jgi:hypothetical protein